MQKENVLCVVDLVYFLVSFWHVLKWHKEEEEEKEENEDEKEEKEDQDSHPNIKPNLFLSI